MAAIDTQSVDPVDKVCLRVLVDKERNKVVYAEAGKDFVDVLFSFLSLPLGTIARLVAKDSNIEPLKFGSISSLYQSVSVLEEQYLWSPTCKDMLLQPRNSMEGYCHKLKLNIDDTPAQYFVCKGLECRRNVRGCLLSIFRDNKCYCGQVMNTEALPDYTNIENGFVKENASFIICADLHVMPNVFGASLQLLQKVGHDTIDAIDEQTVDIDKKEVLDILKLSLVSKTPLTDFILKKNQYVDSLNLRNNLELLVGEIQSDVDMHMSVKVTLRKSNGEILFVEAEDTFIDFVFSFLTFPLGGVLHMLKGHSSLTCIDNLYKSLSDLSPDIYLISRALKEKLVNPRIAAQFELDNQILPICPAFFPMNYCYTYYDRISGSHVTNLTKEKMVYYPMDRRFYPEHFIHFKLVNPKSFNGKSSYAKGPSMYMVTDDLCVTPMSSISTMSYLKSSKVPLSDLEERVIKIGVNEGLSILKASLISMSALTNGLQQFITTIKDDHPQALASADSAPQGSVNPEFNSEALVGICDARNSSVEPSDGSSGVQVMQVPKAAALVEELPPPPPITKETSNAASLPTLRRGTRKRKPRCPF